jgi:group II intron reverse transcriptase/maturase
MDATKIAKTMSPKLRKVAELVKRDPHLRLRSLAHLLDEEALGRAFARLRADAGAGVDGLTKQDYGGDLAANIRGLHARMKAGQYRHRPIRRVNIPKATGGTRPIGVSCIEDKLVQGALAELLEAIYEQVFLDCSYGFRPGRSAHDALRTLNAAAYRGEIGWVLEADIESFFDSIDRKKLKQMIEQRIDDRSLMRLVGKCLHVGVLEDAEYSEPDTGTVQGSRLSPLLGNIYLHYALDAWFQDDVRPRLRGRATLIRYADDFVIGFERQDDAERVMAVIGARMQRFGLRLHPDKTRLRPFQRPAWRLPPGEDRRDPETFDFLGFTVFWRKSRGSAWVLGLKTRKARLRRAIESVTNWCRKHLHEPVFRQHVVLRSKLDGHMNYFGVNGNLRSLERLSQAVRRVWRHWLQRRGQRARIPWERFDQIVARYPLPRPSVRVHIWLPSP